MAKYLLIVVFSGFILMKGFAISQKSRSKLRCPATVTNEVEVEVEKYLLNQEILNCDIIIFIGDQARIKPVKVPAHIFSEGWNELGNNGYPLKKARKSPCHSVLVIPGTTDLQKLFLSFEQLLTKNIFAQVESVLFIGQKTQFKNCFGSATWDYTWKSKVAFLHEADNGGIIREPLFGKPCSYKNPVCFLKTRRLRIAFNGQAPYLHVRSWSQYLNSGIPYPDIILNASMSGDELDVVSGVEGQLLRHLVTEYKMVLHLVAPPDRNIGARVGIGNWSGKYGLLADGKVDMAISLITHIQARLEIGKFLPSLYSVNFLLISKKPLPTLDWGGPFLVFSDVVWMALLLEIFIVAAVAWIITKEHKKLVKTKKMNSIGYQDICVEIAKSMLDQPVMRLLEGPAVCIFGGVFASILILHCTYGSDLTARLSLPMREKHVDSLEDAIEMGKTLLLVQNGTMHTFLQSTSQKLKLNRLEEMGRIRYSNEFFKLNTPFRDIISNDSGLIVTGEIRRILFKLVQEGLDPSEYYFSRHPVLSIFCSWIISKDMALEPALRIAISRAESAGLLKKWLTDPSKLELSDGERYSSRLEDSVRLIILQNCIEFQDVPLQLGHLKGAFLLWIIGMLISLPIFWLEMYTWRSVKGK